MALDLTSWEGRRFPPVTRSLTSFRRIAALLAVLALVYATGFVTLAHSTGMPMTELTLAMPAGTAMSHDHAHMNPDTMNHDAMDHAAINHDMADHEMTGHEMAVADQPAPPCDTGCTLCKDCALCLFTGLPAMTLPSVALQFAGYRPLAAALRSGIRPDLPAEPPRV